MMGAMICGCLEPQRCIVDQNEMEIGSACGASSSAFAVTSPPISARGVPRPPNVHPKDATPYVNRYPNNTLPHNTSILKSARVSTASPRLYSPGAGVPKSADSLPASQLGTPRPYDISQHVSPRPLGQKAN
uniref:Uncharacterized protein n=1 Tax=Vitrella brassicaformis TaxID=1169539 RepID=A0A7S1KJG6_9ALVE|mmetsp:Transcript_8403/g.20556  ORF Transcript_8403/g.20556 Transcript_8403/m.20556 type:complete len:131 (+) Transcript_8403:261-653(+)